jgi:hypothetical protein
MTLWDKILETELAAAKRHPKLWGGTSEAEIRNILIYYGLHGGLFYSTSSDGRIDAVMLAHPGAKLPDWEWDSLATDWTIFTAWANSREAFEDMVNRGLQEKKPDLIYAVRNGIIREVTPQKLTRLFYGRRRNHSSNATATEIR